MDTYLQKDINHLLPILKDLQRPEKLFIIQFLAAELAQQEGNSLGANLQYPVWSPYDSHEAANTLLQLLNEPTSEKYE